jgi:ABC-type glycerol-3-phosphate transport system substrate-binding protein
MHIFRRTLLFLLAVSVLAGFAGAGCSRSKSPGVSSDQAKVFDSASDDIKQTWEKAQAADATNNYVDTLNALNQLKQIQLSDAQRDVLNKKFDDFDQRLWSAAAKNDPSAVAAAQVMRSRPGVPANTQKN